MWPGMQFAAAWQSKTVIVGEDKKFYHNPHGKRYTPLWYPGPNQGSFQHAIAWTVPSTTIDIDGAVDCYGPPLDHSHPLRQSNPVNGKIPRDGIRNATNLIGSDGKKNSNFMFDRNGNNQFKWTSVVTKRVAAGQTADADVDHQRFLKDVNSNYPVKRQDGDFAGFYIATTSRRTQAGEYVDALTVPYGVRTAAIHRAGFEFGDCGIAIHMPSGTATAFMFCDSNGTGEVHEFSVRVTDIFGGPRSANDPVFVMVFHGSAISNQTMHVDKLENTTQSHVRSLNPTKGFHQVVEHATKNQGYRRNIYNGLASYSFTSALQLAGPPP